MKTNQQRFFKWTVPLVLVLLSNWVQAQTDVTSTYLTNAGFDANPTHAVDATGNQGATAVEIDSWSLASTGFDAAATFEYGTAVTLNGKSVPSFASDGTTTGSGQGTLGIMNAWGNSCYYYQDVTLPEGTYKLSYKGYNANTGGSVGKSICGWVPSSGTSALSTIDGGFTAETWVSDEISFFVTEETTGRIQIGMSNSGSGSGDKAHVFFDDIMLEFTAPTQSLDATLKALTTDVGTLDPVFDPEVTSYSLVVPDGTASVNLTATKNDDKASVSGDGTIDLSTGLATANILVTSEGGAQKTYTVSIKIDKNWTGVSGYAMNLPGVDGNNSNINISGLGLNTLPYTIEMWIKSSASQVANTGLIFNRPGNFGFQYTSGWQSTSQSVRYMASGGDTYGSNSLTPDIPIDEWHHVAIVMTETSRTVYYDGEPSSETASFTANDFTSGSTYIGWDSDAANRAFNGYFDEIRVWNTEKTLASLDAPISNPATETGLVAYYNFDDQATAATDLTGGGNDGVITGGSYISLALSSDATLKALSVDAGSILPAFSPEVSQYYVYAPSGTTSVNVSAMANDDNAMSISGTGAIDVTSGNASTTITVTAEAGNTLDYILNIFVNDANLVGWSDGNGGVSTSTGTAPNDYGWANTAGYNSWTDYNGGGGCRLRDNYTGYTFEDGGATVTGAQLLLRYDGDAASETAAFTYPVVLAANTVYDFSFDYVFGGSGSAPAVLTAGIGTSNDVVSDIASKEFETASNTSLYRKGKLTFMTGDAGVYYVKFTCNERSWQGVNNLLIEASNAIVWDGSGWSNTTGPTVADDVLIDGSLSLTGDLMVNDITVSLKGSVTIESGASLKIMGTASGNVTVKRNTTGNGGYSIIGANVSGADLSSLSADYLYGWDGSAWTMPTGTMTPGMGYFVGYNAASPVVTLTGALVSGDQSVAVSSTGDGFNLVANPYAASISVASFLSANQDIDDAVYFWNDGGANNGADRAGDYVTVNAVGTVGSVDLGDGVAGQNTSAANTDIASSQGFFVHSTNGGTVSFTPAMQAGGSNSDDNFYRSTPQSTLKLALSGDHYNEVLFGFRADATEGVDKSFDAVKRAGNENFSFYSMIDTEKFAIQGLPELNGVTNISLGYDVKTSGTYELSIKSIEGIKGYRVFALHNGESFDLTSGPATLSLSEGSGVIELQLMSAILASNPASSFSVYGAEGSLNIRLAQSVERANIQILDMTGRTIVQFQNQDFDNGQWSKHVTLKSDNIYIVKVQTSAGVFTQKFIF